MLVAIPPATQALLRTLQSVPAGQDRGQVIAAAKRALADYQELAPAAKAAYLHQLRRERGHLQAGLEKAMEYHATQYRSERTAARAELAGRACMQAGRPDLAVGFFLEEIDLEPNNADAHAHLAEARLKSAGRGGALNAHTLRQVRQDFERAASLDSDTRLHNLEAAKTLEIQVEADALDTPGDFQSLGLARLLVDDHTGAKDAFELAVEVQPDNPDYLNSLSLSCSYAGQFGRAATLALQAVELSDKTSTANLALATAGLVAAVAANR